MTIQGDGPVIMVDDNETDFYIANLYCKRSRVPNEFLHMPSGFELLAYLDKVEAGGAPLPGMVLLDINMPGLNGFDTLEAMRSRKQFQEVPVVMMLTTSARAQDRDRAMELGANGFTTKPLDGKPYIEFFNSLLGE